MIHSAAVLSFVTIPEIHQHGNVGPVSAPQEHAVMGVITRTAQFCVIQIVMKNLDVNQGDAEATFREGR